MSADAGAADCTTLPRSGEFVVVTAFESRGRMPSFYPDVPFTGLCTRGTEDDSNIAHVVLSVPGYHGCRIALFATDTFEVVR